jgi:hypothetical protein
METIGVRTAQTGYFRSYGGEVSFLNITLEREERRGRRKENNRIAI